MPNGLVFSPDERTLCLIEAHPDANHNQHIYVHPVLENEDTWRG
ncbi:MAG: hypothetical protein M2R45_04329 [Verrucomicrobia subdivision 3 bacterium]|nr:hypothetical protein [Limisphaerales bacterium]MCS1417245.1 hypothetical protein [Limisphaerales bacterium]